MKNELERAISDFIQVARLAGNNLNFEDISIEHLGCPHISPKDIPKDKVAVYIFYFDKQCLKVGQVGKKSKARYSSQHYNPNSSNSNLAKTILKNQENMHLSGLTSDNISEWIKTHTHRVNILMNSSIAKPLLSLLEVFLQCRLNPIFEGQGQ